MQEQIANGSYKAEFDWSGFELSKGLFRQCPDLVSGGTERYRKCAEMGYSCREVKYGD